MFNQSPSFQVNFFLMYTILEANLAASLHVPVLAVEICTLFVRIVQEIFYWRESCLENTSAQLEGGLVFWD
jgi:hypothetical protein